MSKWARIENNRVMEITDIDPEGRFHPSLIWVPCDDEVDQHFTFDGTGFVPPPPPPPTTAEDLAPGRTLEGLTASEIADLEALAGLLNSDPQAIANAAEVTNG